MPESNLDARTEAMEGPVRIALLQSEIERLRCRDVEREAELAARERRIRLLEEALRVLQADRFGASREKLHVAPGQSELFNEAEALAESKAWLRGAGPEEVGAALAALPRGTIVRREAVAPKPAARPYEDPTYWAGFILIGSPD